MGDGYYWIRLKPEWPPKGWCIGKRQTHQFDGNTYQWHLFSTTEYHVYDHCVEEVGPKIRPPSEGE